MKNRVELSGIEISVDIPNKTLEVAGPNIIGAKMSLDKNLTGAEENTESLTLTYKEIPKTNQVPDEGDPAFDEARKVFDIMAAEGLRYDGPDAGRFNITPIHDINRETGRYIPGVNIQGEGLKYKIIS